MPSKTFFFSASLAVAATALAAGCVSGYSVAAAPIAGNDMQVRTALNEQLCWDVKHDKAVGGVPVQLYHCKGSENQRWTFSAQPDGLISVIGIGGLCLDTRDRRGVNDAAVELWACSSQPSQRFRHNADGRLVEAQSGECLTVRAANPELPVTLAMCDVNNGGQVWTIAK
jgi:hypothetical protein